MSKTAFSTKCEILGFLWENYREESKSNETWDTFFRWADIGLPLSYIVSEKLGTITKDGKEYVEKTWEEFCSIVAIDSESSYKDLNECFQASPYLNYEDDDDEEEEVAEA